MSILEMSFYGGVMILAVVVLRALTVHRLPKRTFVVLWLLTLTRLLLPFTIPSPASVYTLAGEHNHALPIQIPTPRPAVTAPAFGQGTIPVTGNGALPAVTAPAGQVTPVTVPAVTAPAPAPTPTVPVWTLVWLGGLAVCALFFLFVYVKNQREFRMSLPVENAFLTAWLEGHPLGRRVRVRQYDRITAPLTYGLVRPVILLPADTDWDNGEELSYVLEHEFIHIKRWDGLTKLLLAAAVCVHWFNPLVWIMFFLANRDLELSCDEGVLRRFGTGRRGDYARTLIGMEETRAGLTPIYNHFSKSAIEERVVAIMKTKKLSLAAVIAAVALVAAVAVMFATSPREEAVDTTPTPSEQVSATPDPIESAPAVVNTAKPGDQETVDDFGFLAGEYHFLSGAGGWETELTINRDGTFYGQYHDSEMGEYDPIKYPNGTVYICNFTGSFQNLWREDNYTWTMELGTLNYPAPEESYVEGGTRYITSTPYGLDEAEEITVYLPGTPVSSLPEEALSWLSSAPGFWDPENRPGTLPFTVLYNGKEGEAFFQDNSLTHRGDTLVPLEEAVDGPELSWRLEGESLFLGDGAVEIELRSGDYYVYRRGYVTDVLQNPMVLRDGVPHLPISFCSQYLSEGGDLCHAVQYFFKDEIWDALGDPTASASQRVLAAVSLPRSMGIETVNLDPNKIFEERELDDYPEALAAELTGMGVPNAHKRTYSEYRVLTEARTVARAGLANEFLEDLPGEDPDDWTVGEYYAWQQSELLESRLADLTEEERKFVEEKDIQPEDLPVIQREFYFDFLSHTDEELKTVIEAYYQFALAKVMGE